MKNLSFILGVVLSLFLAGCTSDEPVQAPVPDTQAKSTTIRTESEAIELAQAIADARVGESRAYDLAPQATSSVKVVYGNSSRAATDTLIYAVDYADNAGYALISAALTGEAVLAYTDKGQYDETLENPGLAYYMDYARAYVGSEMANSSGIGDTPVPDPSRPITTITTVRNRISVNWGQTFPEGLFCPNGICGCVQTAMAQIMSYLRLPSQIQLTYPERDKDFISLNWGALNNHKKSFSTRNEYNNHLSKCTTSEDAHLDLARLCRELGYRNNAVYGDYSTGAVSYDAYLNFKELLPNNRFSDFRNLSNYDLLYFELEQGDCVAYLRGSDSKYGGGHAWVCDGGQQSETRRTVIKYDGTEETQITLKTYFHFNWGWNGLDNGYFYAGVFDPSKGSSTLPLTPGLPFEPIEPILPDKPIDLLSRSNYESGAQYFLVYK